MYNKHHAIFIKNTFSRSCAKCTVAVYKFPRIAEKHEERIVEAGRQRKIILQLFASKLYYELSVYAWETLYYTEGMF